jgi:hypothetical protein
MTLLGEGRGLCDHIYRLQFPLAGVDGGLLGGQVERA